MDEMNYVSKCELVYNEKSDILPNNYYTTFVCLNQSPSVYRVITVEYANVCIMYAIV